MPYSSGSSGKIAEVLADMAKKWQICKNESTN